MKRYERCNLQKEQHADIGGYEMNLKSVVALAQT